MILGTLQLQQLAASSTEHGRAALLISLLYIARRVMQFELARIDGNLTLFYSY